ncbi:hypothetical protein CUMW_034370 [Citrus unshiu]|nr:hypothetical protein CUMW_034370 [Citrus unshiu]
MIDKVTLDFTMRQFSLIMVAAISEENPRTRKPKGRFVSSRYLSPSPSSSSSSTTATATAKSQESEPEIFFSTCVSSLAVSFQGEAFSLPISKTKAKATPETRRGTPVRDQPWPGRTQQGNPICQGCWILVLRRRLNSMRTPPRTRTKEELKEAYI